MNTKTLGPDDVNWEDHGRLMAAAPELVAVEGCDGGCVVNTITLGDGKTYQRRAWTGGKGNFKDCVHPDYQWLRRWFFREQVKECGGLDLWACAGTSALERARIFWNRASLDALATLDLN